LAVPLSEENTFRREPGDGGYGLAKVSAKTLGIVRLIKGRHLETGVKKGLEEGLLLTKET